MQYRPGLLSGIHSLQRSTPRLGWRPHGTPGALTAGVSTKKKKKCAQRGAARLWGRSSPACNLHVMLHVDPPLLAQLFPNLVSWRDASQHQVSFRKKYYSKSLQRGLLISSPPSLTTFLPQRQKSFYNTRVYLIYVAQQPHKAESSAGPQQ